MLRTFRVILTTGLMISCTGVAALGAQSSPGGFSEAPIEEIPEYAPGEPEHTSAEPVYAPGEPTYAPAEPTHVPAEIRQESIPHFAEPTRAQPIDSSTLQPENVASEGCSTCQDHGASAGVSCLCAGPGNCSGCPRCSTRRNVPQVHSIGAVRDLAGRMRRGRNGSRRSARRQMRSRRGGALRDGLRSGLGSRTTVDDVTLRGPDSTSPDLFYNYYQGADAGADYTAGMYPSPHPTSPITGQTYYTYQPFLPHEYMYMHSRSYYRMYNFNQGLNRTHVSYKPNSRTSLRQMFHWVFEPVR